MPIAQLAQYHRTLALLIIYLHAGCALWAGLHHLLFRGRPRPLPSFVWAAVALATLAAVAQGAIGFPMWLAGLRPAAPGMHIAYGIFVLIGGVVTLAYRPGGELRPREGPFAEARTVALACFVVAALALRAHMTGRGP